MRRHRRIYSFSYVFAERLADQRLVEVVGVQRDQRFAQSSDSATPGILDSRTGAATA